MKKLIPLALAVAVVSTGCLNLEFGGGSSTRSQAPTVGQQLIDLQHAKDAGVISEAEYQAQRTKILGQNK